MEDMRMFSQEGEISQLTGCYGRERNEDEPNGDNVGGDEDTQHSSESQFSRAQAICEENRQLDYIVESQLSGLDKRRMLLASKTNHTKKDSNKYKEIHECLRQKSLKFQMSLEEYTEKYQSELSERTKLKEKAKNLDMMICLEEYFDNLKSFGNEMKEFKNNCLTQFEESFKKNISARTVKMKNDKKQKIEHVINHCKEVRADIMKQREENVEMIQNSAREQYEVANSINNLQQGLKVANSDLEATDLNKVINKKKSMTEELHSLHAQLDEHRRKVNGHIQHFKLEVNNKQNHVSNFEEKFKEKEYNVNNFTFKLNEGLNLSNQMKTSVEEISQRNQALIENIEEILYKNKVFEKDTGSFTASLDQLIERENNWLRNEQLEKDNYNLKSLLTKLSSEELEIENVKMSLENEIEEIERKIEVCDDNVAKTVQVLKQKTEEWENTITQCNERLGLKSDELESYKILLSEVKPIQDEQKPVLLNKKLSLENELKVESEMYQKEIQNLGNSHLAQITEKNQTMENNKTILEKLLSDEDIATDKYTEDTKNIEKTKLMLEKEIAALNNMMKGFKKTELMKRHLIAKTEKRLNSITKEVKVRHEDISNAYSGKVTTAPTFVKPIKHKLMTPSNSSGEPPSQRIHFDQDKSYKYQVPAKAVKTNIEINTMEDEYDFSEI